MYPLDKVKLSSNESLYTGSKQLKLFDVEF